MSNHTPMQSGAVYRCDCGFHAVATTNGMHVITSGAGRDIHLAAIATARLSQRAWVERVQSRLRWQYCKGALDLGQLRRLYRWVEQEFEG